MFWPQKKLAKTKSGDFEEMAKSIKMSKNNWQKQKMAILQNRQKTTKWQFWATFFDLLTFKDNSTDSFDMISRKVFEGLVT